ncbi:hypothetical protein FGG15_00420 [Flagellimonas algicola]|uniref:Uncharacterized protein n=1 Tax=Flagellimonas algicola TaxID=2583815 RepID=A0ABY2WM07_9FLAO|nr:hypothetical protein FGG15_00420 [Allomuricauda algicola]
MFCDNCLSLLAYPQGSTQISAKEGRIERQKG